MSNIIPTYLDMLKDQVIATARAGFANANEPATIRARGAAMLLAAESASIEVWERALDGRDPADFAAGRGWFQVNSLDSPHVAASVFRAVLKGV